jgi:hypothetical protein
MVTMMNVTVSHLPTRPQPNLLQEGFMFPPPKASTSLRQEVYNRLSKGGWGILIIHLNPPLRKGDLS